MKDEFYYRLKELVEQIDTDTRSADELKKILKSIKEHGAESKLFTYINGETCQITLPSKIAEIALTESIKLRSDSAKKVKKEMDEILENIFADYSKYVQHPMPDEFLENQEESK